MAVDFRHSFFSMARAQNWAKDCSKVKDGVIGFAVTTAVTTWFRPLAMASSMISSCSDRHGSLVNSMMVSMDERWSLSNMVSPLVSVREMNDSR